MQEKLKKAYFGLNGKLERFNWRASYSFVRATYDSDIDFVNGSNAEGVDTEGIYTAKSGDRIPVIPQHQLKLRGQFAVTPSWNVGANVVGYSNQYVLGNENNNHRANATQCNGGEECAPGKGNLSGRLIESLFDANGQFGAESKVLSLLTGAPRAAWLGVRYDFAVKKLPLKFR
jgi:hypothetical protein